MSGIIYENIIFIYFIMSGIIYFIMSVLFIYFIMSGIIYLFILS